MTDPIDILVIAAHPDDAEICLGGTLLLAKDLGHRTAVLDLTRGELSTRGDLVTRAAETAKATALLGLDHRENLDLGDGAVRDEPAAREKLVDAIRRLRPSVVLAPFRDDLHADHSGAGELAYRAWYLCGVAKFAPGRAPFRPPFLGYYMLHTPFVPDAVIDVTATWERKLAVIAAFGSQFHRAGYDGPPTKISQPHFMDAVTGRAREYGMQAGCEYGEPIGWDVPLLVTDPMRLGARPQRRP